MCSLEAGTSETMDHGGKSIKYSLELGPPPPELLLHAVTDIRETNENKQQALQELKQIIAEDENLNCEYLDDEYLLRFLRPTKFYPESAAEKLRNYLALIRKCADLYVNIGMPNTLAAIHKNIFFVSPRRDQYGRRICIARYGVWSSKICSKDDLFITSVACAEVGVREPTTQLAGSVTLFDMRGISFSHVTQLSPSYCKRLVDWVQYFPLRFKSFHIVNQPKIFDLVFAAFKPFLDNKLRSRIFFHGSDMDSLHQHINPACLPREYGGDLETLDSEPLLDTVTENEHVFKDIRAYAYEYKK